MKKDIIKKIIQEVKNIPIRYSDGYEDYIRSASDFKEDVIKILEKYNK